jgi:hypothetical protein
MNIIKHIKQFSRVNIDPTLLAACSIVLSFMCLGVVLGYFAAYQHLLPIYEQRIVSLEYIVKVLNSTTSELLDEVYRGQ